MFNKKVLIPNWIIKNKSEKLEIQENMQYTQKWSKMNFNLKKWENLKL